jgi:hypothetical protein
VKIPPVNEIHKKALGKYRKSSSSSRQIEFSCQVALFMGERLKESQKSKMWVLLQKTKKFFFGSNHK